MSEVGYDCGGIPTGDRGQRFELRGKREHDGVEIALGWATTREAAEGMAGGFRKWPYLVPDSVWVKDRLAPAAPAAG